jgi:membrane protein YdbS with pleckstrin-like domain
MTRPYDALHARFERFFSVVEQSRAGRWILGINVIVTIFMAGAVSLGVVLISIIERQVVTGLAGAAIAFVGSVVTNAVESHRVRKRAFSHEVLNRKLKHGYWMIVEQSQLYRE